MKFYFSIHRLHLGSTSSLCVSASAFLMTYISRFSLPSMEVTSAIRSMESNWSPTTSFFLGLLFRKLPRASTYVNRILMQSSLKTWIHVASNWVTFLFNSKLYDIFWYEQPSPRSCSQTTSISDEPHTPSPSKSRWRINPGLPSSTWINGVIYIHLTGKVLIQGDLALLRYAIQ